MPLHGAFRPLQLLQCNWTVILIYITAINI